MESWNPIISSGTDLGRKAWDAASAIVEGVFNRSYPPLIEKKWPHQPEDEALLFAYWSVTRNESDWADRAVERLNAAIDAAAARTKYLGLYGGLCGIGWSVQHVSQLLESGAYPSDEVDQDGLNTSEPEEEDPVAEIDTLVLKALRQSHWPDYYDLIGGLAGCGVYFLERLPSEAAAEGLKLIVGHLASSAEYSSEGITWFTPKEFVPEWQRELFPDGYYNLGVAHGIPGILHLLSEVSAAGIEKTKCLELLDGAVRWLLTHQAPPEKLFRFYSWVVPGKGADSRLTWCYGDPGLLAVLLQIARRTGRRDWRQFAHSLLDQCLAWPAEQSGLADAPLCHGTTGIAHLFNRIYQSEGDRRCLDASLAWFERTLAMRQPGAGVGGFLQLTRPEQNGPIVWESSAAFLDGASGIALALLAALTSIEPKWDRLLLLSGRSANHIAPCPEEA